MKVYLEFEINDSELQGKVGRIVNFANNMNGVQYIEFVESQKLKNQIKCAMGKKVADFIEKEGWR